MILEESVHAFAFLMIVYDSSGDDEITDRFLKRDMTAESLRRSDLFMLLEWRQACIADGLFAENNVEFETRQDVDGVSRRQ